MFKSVGLVARFDKTNAVKLAKDLGKYLSSKGLAVYIEDTLAGKANLEGELVPLNLMKTDFVITIGGDGTILRASISLPKPEPPILPINMGVRGFLTEVEPSQTFDAIDKCLNNEFQIEKHMKLSVAAGNMKLPDALNEVMVSTDEPAKLLYAHLMKDDESIMKCQSDGLMVATPTGSTGYSLSAGGPVLDSDLDAFVLTPICPLSVFHPIVFPANSRLNIKVKRPKKILVLIDGHHQRILRSRLSNLAVTRSKHETFFIRFRANFYHRLRNRLLFKGVR